MLDANVNNLELMSKEELVETLTKMINGGLRGDSDSGQPYTDVILLPDGCDRIYGGLRGDSVQKAQYG